MSLFNKIKETKDLLTQAFQIGVELQRGVDIFGDVVKTVNGYFVYRSPKFAILMGMSPSMNITNAWAIKHPGSMQPVIVVNGAFENAPKEVQDALLAHEVGHHKCGHLDARIKVIMDGKPSEKIKMILRNPLRALGLSPEAVIEELEADAYSAKQGFSMQDALEHLYKDVVREGGNETTLNEINLRINHLKATAKV